MKEVKRLRDEHKFTLETLKKEKEEYDKVNKKSGSNGPGVRVRR
jgi:hypothetical protein